MASHYSLQETSDACDRPVFRYGIDRKLGTGGIKSAGAGRYDRRYESLVKPDCCDKYSFHLGLRFNRLIIFSRRLSISCSICRRESLRREMGSLTRAWNTTSTFRPAPDITSTNCRVLVRNASRINRFILFLLTALPKLTGTFSPTRRGTPSLLKRYTARTRCPLTLVPLEMTRPN